MSYSTLSIVWLFVGMALLFGFMTFVLLMLIFRLKGSEASSSSRSMVSSSSKSLLMRIMSSVKRKLFNPLLSTFMPFLSHCRFFSAKVNNLGEMVSPCFSPLCRTIFSVVHSSRSLTCNVACWYIRFIRLQYLESIRTSPSAFSTASNVVKSTNFPVKM